MTTVAQFRMGRILLHLLAMLGDRCVSFHISGIMRELAWVAPLLTILHRVRIGLVGACVRYLAEPRLRGWTTPVDPQSLATMLDPGDVLLSEGNTRAAVLVKGLTRSTWSHVSIYVGPLEEGFDPLCIVEADIAAGVRAIRLSELNALRVRVLRPNCLKDLHRRQLTDWVVSRIGSEYDLAHALTVARKLLRLPVRSRSASGTASISATRFICCSLLANAFAFVGHPILPVHFTSDQAMTADFRYLTPGDFERAPLFDVI